MDNPKLIITGDGSHSIFNEKLNEHYHSDKGAIAESIHVFIENGLMQISKTDINIFEIGFGTGLNTLLTYKYAIENNLNINYFSIEKFPVSIALAKQLNYPVLLQTEKELFVRLHESDWNTTVKISGNFYLTKFQADLSTFDFNLFSEIDLVYFDAFSPSKQPEMWTTDIFKKIYSKMQENGLLTTYSSAGLVKNALREAGFTVKRKPGAHGKFHMLNAFKQ